MSHSVCTLTPPTEDWAQTPQGGTEHGFLVSTVSLRNTPWGGGKREDQKLSRISGEICDHKYKMNQWRGIVLCVPQRSCGKKPSFLLPLPMLAQNRYSVGPEPEQPAPPLQQSCRSQTPNCDAQWIKQKVWRHLISPSLRVSFNATTDGKTTRTEKCWPESRVLSRFILKCKSTLKKNKVC